MDQLSFDPLANLSARVPSCKLRIAGSFSLEQLFSTEPLRVVGVPDLVPGDAPIKKIGIKSALRNDAFNVALAREIKELFACEFYMVAVEKTFPPGGRDAS